MIISSADITMSSKYSRLEKYEKTEELTVWTGDNPFLEDEDEQPVRDRVSLTDEARNYLDKKRETLSSQEIDVKPGEAGDLMFIKLLVEAFSGREINLKELTEIDDDEELKELSAEMEGAQAAEDAPEKEGWGVIYNSHESYTEHEKMMFKAKGTIRTEDGREIDFKLHLKMHRKYHSEESVSIRAGDAALIDPLVINYAGPAADLTSTKFSFDIDSDGEDNSISFVKSGSGLLALDLNSDGIVNNGGELFGPSTGNGFSELAAYDEDGNNWIDEKDSVFSKLKIWSKDAEGNDSFSSLLEKNVGAIYLSGVDSPFSIKDTANELQGQVAKTGIYADERGTVGTVQQVNLVA